MAKPNYQFEKRQRDLAKKSKKEEKLRQKQAANSPAGAADSPVEVETPSSAAPEQPTQA